MLLNFGLKLLTPHQGIPGAVQSGLQTQDVREQDVQLRLQSSGWFGETSHASTKPGWAATLKTETGTTALILALTLVGFCTVLQKKAGMRRLWEPPKTAFRGWVDGLGSRFGVIGFMATSLVCVFPTFDSVFLLGCLLFLGLNCAFQAARNGNNFNRTICS